MRLTASMLALLLLVGCSQPKLDEPATSDSSLFGPTAMRVHPIFTQLKDWTGDGKPDGFEVLLEFQDQFGDPTKASGTVMFEVFDYRQGNPEPRGARLVNPWIGSMATIQDQTARWNRTSRTYTFQLAFAQANPQKTYVLTAMFRSSEGGRFFDRVVIEGQEERFAPASPSSTQPVGTSVAQP